MTENSPRVWQEEIMSNKNKQGYFANGVCKVHKPSFVQFLISCLRVNLPQKSIMEVTLAYTPREMEPPVGLHSKST